jgi:hypothetical protein
MDIVMPGDVVNDQTVIASCYLNVGLSTALVILMNKRPPYYTVAELNLTSLKLTDATENFMNINKAVAFYADMGGDI